MSPAVAQVEQIISMAKSTGVVVTIVEMGSAAPPELRFQLTCETHDQCSHQPTLDLARSHMEVPEEWCPLCEALYQK